MRLNLDILRAFFSKQPVDKAWIFGSYAKGEENDASDLDILVSFNKNAKVGLLKHADMILQLEKLLNLKVDLVPENSLYPQLRESIMSSRFLIYERH